MYFWQIKILIGCIYDSVGCIYDSTNFFGCINVRRQQFAKNTATLNPLVVKMAAFRVGLRHLFHYREAELLKITFI